MFKLQGIYAPIPTPFEANGDIAWGKLESNAKFLTDSSIDGIVVMGSNGEFVTLSHEEKKQLITKVCELAKGKKKVAVGCGCESTRQTIELCEHAAKAGADAALVLNPNYYKGAMKENLYKTFYQDVADASPIPVVVYNMPGNTGVNLSGALTASLAKHPNIVGVKDTSGNIVQIAEIIRDTENDGFGVFAGSTGFFYATVALGGAGGTLALANIMPEECVQLYKLIKENKHDEAAKLQKKLLAINAAITSGFGIAGLKAAMEMIGLYGGPPRRPLLPLSEDDRKTVKAIFDAARS